LSYKRAWQDTFRGIQSISVATRNSVTLLLESSLLKIDISLFYKYPSRTSCNITSSANKSGSYLHLIVSCCELEFQFLSVPTHSGLPSRSTCSAFYVPNSPSPLVYNSTINKMQRFLDLFVSINCSTCFRRFLRPSSGAQSCTYSVRSHPR